MRRVISAALAMVMVMAISIPAFAIDKEREVSRQDFQHCDGKFQTQDRTSGSNR